MVKVLIILVLIWFFIINPLVVYWAKQMEDPFTLKLTFGKMGVGKTGLIAKLSMKDLQDKDAKNVICLNTSFMNN